MAQIDDRSHITAKRKINCLHTCKHWSTTYALHTVCMLHAEFEDLKDELERLLGRNRGLTRAGAPRTAAASFSSSNSSRSSGARNTASSVYSRHSSSLSQNSSCSSFTSDLLGHANSQPAQQVSAAERASQQLNHDVDILLKQVDSVMAAPVLQLPAWFTKTPAAATCTVTELPPADQTPPASQSAQLTQRVVTPKLKANSFSTADSHTSACQDIKAAVSTATSAAQQQPTKACSTSSAAFSLSGGTAAEQGIGMCFSSNSAVDAVVAREPDNLTILHVACSTTPSQSDDTATTIKNGHQARSTALPSPKEWHTNHMADSDGSVSSTADSIHPAASSVAAEAAVPSADSLAGAAAISVMREAKTLRRRGGTQDSLKAPSLSSKTSNGQRACGRAQPKSPDKDQDDLPGPDQDDLHSENVAPGWHRQPLQNVKRSDAASVKLAQPEGGADADMASGLAGQGGLMEGYLRGSSAKLQLPASVRTGSRKSAITARTPLKTITEVWHSHCATRLHASMYTVHLCVP